jgi:hypothetical protein
LLLVANEGERFQAAGGAVENAPGTITIIAVPLDASQAAVRNTIGFSALDPFERSWMRSASGPMTAAPPRPTRRSRRTWSRNTSPSRPTAPRPM